MSGFGGFNTGTFGGGTSGGGLFGAKPPDQQTTGFTLPATTTVTTTSSLPFGAPTFGTGTGKIFGAQPQTTSAFATGFGLKPIGTTAPATGTTGFTFGTPAPNTTLPTFGTPTSMSGPPTFGTTAVNTSAPAFGGATTTSSLPAFSSFGAPTTSGFGTSALGTPKTTAATGFTLPSVSSTSSSATPTLNFGLPTVSTSAPLTFGLPTTAAAAGATTTTSASALSFGVPTPGTSTTTQTSGFTLSQPTTTPLTFGLPKTTGSLTFGTGTTTFGTTTATTTTPTFNFGTSTTTTPTLGTGLFGTPKTSENVSVTTSTTITSVGLGGTNNALTTQGLSGPGKTEPKQAKDHTLPEPILQTLNEFQNFTKQQKSISVEISHGSSKPLKKVQEDTEAMESLLTTITSGLTRNAIAVDKLKTETAQGLHQAEMAQRNHETPPGIDYDNSASVDYFNDLVTKFETDTVRLRVQMEASEKHLRSLTQSSTISPQELTLAMRRLHETLIVLAARVQALHTTVQSQKEQYKNLRRVYFKDDTNIFENDLEQSLIKKQTIYSLRSLTGPTPFSDTPGSGPSLQVDGLAMLASSAGISIPTTSTNPSWNLPLQETGTSGSILPNSTFFGAFQPLELQGFQLSKPPTGNKRSRR